MPHGDPDPTDPNVLVGVALPGDLASTREMAEAFADEFVQIGLGRDEILGLFHDPFYRGAHDAFRTLGSDAIETIVDESLAVWGRFRVAVQDRPQDPTDTDLMQADGRLRLIPPPTGDGDA